MGLSDSSSLFDLTFRGTLLLEEPVLVYSGMYAGQQEPNPFTMLADCLSSEEVVWLVLVAWTAEENSASAATISAWRDHILATHRNHRMIFLANTHAEVDNLRSLGAEVLLHNQNMFVDRRLFQPIVPENAKIYDAVYNAQFLSFKRHELCTELSNLVLIGYNFENEHFKCVRELLPDVRIANLDENGNKRWLPQDQVNAIYNSSHCGLCLSKQEGAMHASMEYLLAGIPVVTTINQGGRDFYFDGRFVRWVNDTPSDVCNAVRSLKSEGIDPQFIRSETLRKIDMNIDHFVASISEYLQISPSEFKNSLGKVFNDKLIVPKKLSSIIDQLSPRL
ncbi:hypothetical protein KBY86_10545 [Synechococcus sp. Lug-A]|uniref:hypothetical protein n=1 Tax=Synechococcus sp. Lug-A TaxID=2823740 RepID=UPI0020CF8991|nr:hypothetical protein [Synechococcus sp. Lug-A]MCP9847318.1 hypothetical protein [Synechococcus sp. Lug-A]